MLDLAEVDWCVYHAKIATRFMCGAGTNTNIMRAKDVSHKATGPPPKANQTIDAGAFDRSGGRKDTLNMKCQFVDTTDIYQELKNVQYENMMGFGKMQEKAPVKEKPEEKTEEEE